MIDTFGTILVYTNLGLLCAWTVTFLFRTRWWTNPGGRLVAMLSTWLSIGFIASLIAAGPSSTPLSDLAGSDTLFQTLRIGFNLFVMGSLLFQWKVLVDGWLDARRYREDGCDETLRDS